MTVPARKYRTGQALADWEARKAAQAERMEFARLRVQAMSGHALLRPIEVAAMLGTTPKTLREMEGSGLLTRHVESVVPPAVEYRLTPLGGRFVELVDLVYDWGRDNSDALDQLGERVSSRRRSDRGEPLGEGDGPASDG